jgi:hypothetical protein
MLNIKGIKEDDFYAINYLIEKLRKYYIEIYE